MPFPWKKVKSGRFSQLVSDQIRQRRRKGVGSPLVVQTGFPASLIDLFVKNKDRLKRSSSKKKNKTSSKSSNSFDTNSNRDYFVSDYGIFWPSSPSLPSPPPPSPSSTFLNSHSPLPTLLHHRSEDGDRGVNDDGVVVNGIGGVGGVSGGGCEEGVVGNRILSAILRMFMAVVLAMGTKRFVVGITMSAFLLVFLDYMGKYLFRVFGSCTEAKEKLRFFIRKVMGVFSMRRVNLEVKNRVVNTPTQQAASSALKNQDQGMSNLVGEIEIQKNTDLSGRSEGMEFDRKKVMVVEGEENGDENGELKRTNSRKARMKLKMKELVPKRLRNSRRKGLDFEGVAAQNGAIIEQEEIDQNGDLGKDIMTLETGSDELVEETGVEQNSEYAVLVAIVLVGLVGGRISALMLTVTWCLVRKSGEKLSRSMKFPFIRPPCYME